MRKWGKYHTRPWININTIRFLKCPFIKRILTNLEVYKTCCKRFICGAPLLNLELCPLPSFCSLIFPQRDKIISNIFQGFPIVLQLHKPVDIHLFISSSSKISRYPWHATIYFDIFVHGEQSRCSSATKGRINRKTIHLGLKPDWKSYVLAERKESM